MAIYCLFSVYNDYDQPDFNLEDYFYDNPSLNDISNLIYTRDLEHLSDDAILAVVSIKKGEETRINNTDYRLEKVEERTNLRIKKNS